MGKYYKNHTDEFREDGTHLFRSPRKRGKVMGPNGPHVPNKAERKLLITLMRNSGQTEEEVRASKTNRQRLADAAKSMSRSKGQRELIKHKRIQRLVTFRTNLPHYHPKVKLILEEFFDSGLEDWYINTFIKKHTS